MAFPPPKGEAFAFSDGVHINFERVGNGPLALVMLHGFGVSLDSWRDCATRLEDIATCYLLDAKGSGWSSKPADGTYAPEDQAEIFAAFIERQNLQNVVLCGQSLGGGHAILTYLKLKDKNLHARVKGMVLLDAGGYLQKLPAFIAPLRVPLLNMIILSRPLLPFIMWFTLHQALYDASRLPKGRLRRYTYFLRLPGAGAALRATARQLFTNADTLIPRFKEIDVPTLIIWGDHDRVVPIASAERFHKDIPDSRVVIMKNCGHVPQEEFPDETAAAMREFLSLLSVDH